MEIALKDRYASSLFGGRRFTLENVENLSSLRQEWAPMLYEIFNDPDDVEPLECLERRWADPKKNVFRLLRFKGAPIGMELLQRDPSLPDVLYVPWAGLIAPFRNQGIYPLMADLSNQQMAHWGVRYALYDFEDPARIAPAYPDEPPAQAAARAEGRINFWRRTFLKEDRQGKAYGGCYVVRDPSLPYCRPASSDSSLVQAYDLLAVHPFDEADPMWGQVFNEDGSFMRKEALRRFYIEMHQIQYGDLSERELRAHFPAVELFLTLLDSSSKEWVTVQNGPIRKAPVRSALFRDRIEVKKDEWL